MFQCDQIGPGLKCQDRMFQCDQIGPGLKCQARMFQCDQIGPCLKCQGDRCFLTKSSPSICGLFGLFEK